MPNANNLFAKLNENNLILILDFVGNLWNNY